MQHLRHLLLLIGLATGNAGAGVIDIVFDTPNQNGAAGATLLFNGQISNTGSGTVFFNSNSVNLALNGYTLNDLFIVNVPLFLDGDTTSGSVLLFEVLLSNPLLDGPGFYPGTYTLLGGPDDGAAEILGTWDFAITLGGSAPPSTDVPEPGSTGLLLLGGLVVIAAGRFGSLVNHRDHSDRR